MAHFAHVKNGIVDSVIVIEQETIDAKGGWDCPECGLFAPSVEWIQTSYNTKGGVDTQGGTPLRKNFAGKGYSYDEALDAFIEPKKFDSWVLDEAKGQYVPPKKMPIVDLDVNHIEWDEKTKDWKTMVRADVITEEII